MKITEVTRRALAFRHDEQTMKASGFERTEDFDWRLTRGGMVNKRIAEVKISADGKQVWYRLEDDPAYGPYRNLVIPLSTARSVEEKAAQDRHLAQSFRRVT